jgi:hypothetical protein
MSSSAYGGTKKALCAWMIDKGALCKSHAPKTRTDPLLLTGHVFVTSLHEVVGHT